MGDRDADGQPDPRFNILRRIDRDICEMLGLAKGVLADGRVVEAEAQALREWALMHPQVIDCWPGNALHHRLELIFHDGSVAAEEREDLADLLRQMVGGEAGVMGGASTATTLPLDRPPPLVIFPRRRFVFTGKFAFGPRTACEEAVEKLGGYCGSSVSLDTHYVVIGTFGSRDWIHTTHGRKIQQAVEYRDAGRDLAIIGEDHWAEMIP